jgi:hypothetical protein
MFYIKSSKNQFTKQQMEEGFWHESNFMVFDSKRQGTGSGALDTDRVIGILTSGEEFCAGAHDGFNGHNEGGAW